MNQLAHDSSLPVKTLGNGMQTETQFIEIIQ